tara:strand:+ start:317 stop:754 length:438 start_codon:yes stop_codon:yes gene_type:complete
MAITFTYPLAIPKADDLLIGTQTPDPSLPPAETPTRNFTVQSIIDLAVEGTYLPLSGGTIAGELAIDGDLTLKVTNGFATMKTDVATGGIIVDSNLNVTGSIALQGTNAAISLTAPTAAIYMMSPDSTFYKIQMGNGGVLTVTPA